MKRIKTNNYEERVDESIKISEETSIEGLLDILNFISSELKNFLQEEHRYFGMAKSYMNTIDLTFLKINENINDEDIEIFDKILYLYKPILLKEFIRLHQKRLSAGDSLICIMKKILDIISEYQNLSNKKEIKTLKKIIYKFYENIKNKSKLDPLYNLSNYLRINISTGKLGKYKISSISFKNILENTPKEVFEGDNIKLDETGENILAEINI